MTSRGHPARPKFISVYFIGRFRMRVLLAALLALTLLPLGRATEPVRARHGMVVSYDLIASEVGVSVLKSGGNAVDLSLIHI